MIPAKEEIRASMLLLHAPAGRVGVIWCQIDGCMGGALGEYMPEGVHGQAGWEGQHWWQRCKGLAEAWFTGHVQVR